MNSGAYLTSDTAVMERFPVIAFPTNETEPLDNVPALTHYIYHESFAAPDAEEQFFGEEAEQRFELAALTNNDENGGKPTTEQESLKLQLFLRYNYARYRLSLLLDEQRRPKSPSRVRQALQWQRKALRARSDLVNANMGLVLAMAKRVRIPELEFGELVSQGNLALLRSVENFDFSRGYKFSTYACRAILRSFSRLAAEAGHHRQRFATRSQIDLDLTAPKSNDHDEKWEEAVDDIKEILEQNRAGLSEVEKTIIMERFAIHSRGKGKTYAQIGQLMGLTYERIRQIHKLALSKIRMALEEMRFGNAGFSQRAG